MLTAVINGYGHKNMIQKQSESDKKAFPVILESLKRELQEEAINKDSTMHALIRIILTMHIEKSKVIKENEALSQTDLLAIHTITIEEICRYMCDFRRNNPDVSLRSINNIRLIRMSVIELINNRIKKAG